MWFQNDCLGGVPEAGPTDTSLQPAGAVLLPSHISATLQQLVKPCAAGDGLLAAGLGEDLGNPNSVPRLLLRRLPKYPGQSNLFTQTLLADRSVDK